MKNKTVGWFGPLCCVLALTSASAPFRAAGRVTFQETRRTQEDYMSALLSRDTKTLGLKENPALQRMLRQPAIKWTVRSIRAQVLF